jgi:all-trans-retinol 13,14-reductase
MTYDVIVIGAGMGGLTGAAKLAKHGKKVLLLEKDFHIGGTSYVFRRQGYTFPMGPLSFGYPQKVKEFLDEMGVRHDIDFRRSHFQLISPHINIRYSAPFAEFKEELKTAFPHETKIDSCFSRLEDIIRSVKNIVTRPSEYHGSERIKELSARSSARFLHEYFSNEHLINLLGSMGTNPPRMSLLNLALMWNVMSFEGIWFPSCGIHGLADRIEQAFLGYGGTLHTRSAVSRILVENGAAAGVECADGRRYSAPWIVSNVDYKSTFFDLLDRDAVPGGFLHALDQTAYTHSELCVYLGMDTQAVDFSAMRAPHLFYRSTFEPQHTLDWEDFSNRELEICRWSDKSPDFAPAGKTALVLRIGFPYEHFNRFRTGEKQRREDYAPFKEKLARDLVRTAGETLPGLSSSVEVFEAATPLSYRDWGQRYQGSIAGWTWGIKEQHALSEKILVATPLPRLLMAGIYAASELYLGGVPTAMHTGILAADTILDS